MMLEANGGSQEVVILINSKWLSEDQNFIIFTKFEIVNEDEKFYDSLI